MKGYFIKLAAVRLIGQVWVGELNQSTFVMLDTPNNAIFFAQLALLTTSSIANLYHGSGSPSSEGSLNMNVGGIWRIQCVSSLDRFKSMMQNISAFYLFSFILFTPFASCCKV